MGLFFVAAPAHVSPATYILDGIRGAIIEGGSLRDVAGELATLAAFGAALVPGSIGVFAVAEHWAKKTGRLKRQG